MEPNDETLDDVLDSLRNHLAADPESPAHAMDAPMNLQARLSWPVIDTRVLPDPVAAETFADGIPVLDDMVVAGDPAMRDRIGEHQRSPRDVVTSLRLVTLHRTDAAAPIAEETDSQSEPTSRQPASANTLPGDDGLDLDLTLSPDLSEELVNAIEQGINQHLSNILHAQLAKTVDDVVAELRDDIRTLVRGYVDTYLPELLEQRQDNGAVPDQNNETG